MVIERNNKEIIIRLSSNLKKNQLQNFIDYIAYFEATISSKAKQNDVDNLAQEIQKDWWAKNKKRLTQ